ncbi:MAG: 50S ribosomal protein L23 [Anaerolineaceae bacterium]|nr:50S ribosomal protein L23 [Anaerolineaceae bacterium]
MSTLYDVLRRPLVTEKSNYQVGKLHQYVFEVANNATRSQVKDAVETIFKVKVLRVNVMNMPAKQGRKSRSRRLVVTRPGFKKAIVTLSPEDSLSMFEGV